MNNKFILFFFSIVCFLNAQTTATFADTIRKQYGIPELAYAVVSSTRVLELQTLGVQKINTRLAAGPNDRFRIGSNTKAITGFIAALLVKQQKIKWETTFFDLFPELKQKSNPAYHQLTLLDLVSFRTRLFPYTYTYSEPTRDQFTGDDAQQRYQFATWFFQHEPVSNSNATNFSNLGYVAAGLMLEKVSGKSYKELVQDLGKQLDISFGFGNPNTTANQPWGHDGQLSPEAPGDNYKLNWLLPAGNINVSLPDYTKFIQLQLLGLKGQSKLLSREEFEFLHYGRPRFAVGWFWAVEDGETYSFNVGNPGTFLTKVYVFKGQDKAYILFANSQTAETDTGLNVLYETLRNKYGE